MIVTPGTRRHTKGETTSTHALRITAFAALVALVGGSSALANSGELRVEAGDNPDFLDPALAHGTLSWQIMGATQGGLLAYRRVDGTAGSGLVPDLAAAMPVIAKGGLTLTFRLRDDVRFGPPASRPATASDVKASLERMLRLDSRGGSLYSAIQGAPAVTAGRTGTLSGVTANDDARTVVITLTRPDRTLLEALALPFASVLPKGTRASDQTVNLTPGLGPYVISAFDPDSRIVLTPNPGFSARDGLPAGKTGRITITIGQRPRVAATRVATGQADYSVMPVPVAATKAGGYAHGATANTITLSATAYVAIDATQAPFTNADVRRAIGLALDRQVAAGALSTGARPAARMIPPGTPGHRPATAAMDVATARSLVSRAGATGTAVTLWAGVTAIERAITPAVRDALTRSGLVPTVRSVPRSSGLGRSAPHAALATAVWTQTLPDGSDAYAQLLGRTAPGTPANPPFPAISGNAALRQAARSTAGRARGPGRDAAWARVDARAVADGRAIPVVTPAETQVTASGVTGLMVNPVFGVLLAPLHPGGGSGPSN